jgi:choline dehydrogenase-like flavoprotein
MAGRWPHLLNSLRGKKRIRANKEIIISAGAYRTPQVLMLSGVGPADELHGHGIEIMLDPSDVGRNFQDHAAVSQWWKLKHPEKGLALGSPAFNNPAFRKGLPVDFVATQPVPEDGLKGALAKDHNESNVDGHPLLSLQRGHTETYIIYVARSAENPKIVPDGTHISSVVACLLPTSRGTVTLADSNPKSAPVIDPNYMATDADRYMMREGLRKVRQVLCDTPAGRDMVEGETVEDDADLLSKDSTDEEIDSLIRRRLM